jgi:Signal peptidase, peptidase S26
LLLRATATRCSVLSKDTLRLKRGPLTPAWLVFPKRCMASNNGGPTRTNKGSLFVPRGIRKKSQQDQKRKRGAPKETKDKATIQQNETNDTSTSRDSLWGFRKAAWPAVAQRATPLIIVAGIIGFTNEGYDFFFSYLCPLQIVNLYGPSMLPSIHPYGDIWLQNTRLWDRIRRVYFSMLRSNSSTLYQPGQIAVFRNPKTNQRSCKRIIGVEGDTVQRYGQFVEYFCHRDDLGVPWKSVDTKGLDPSCPWDTPDLEQPTMITAVDFVVDDALAHGSSPAKHATASNSFNADHQDKAFRTLVVPKGHVWVEGDNPLLSIDSRHYGPVPLELLEGKLLWRLWPLLRHPAIRRHDQMILKHRNVRPEPLLDVGTLKQQGQEDKLALFYNLHRPRQARPS